MHLYIFSFCKLVIICAMNFSSEHLHAFIYSYISYLYDLIPSVLCINFSIKESPIWFIHQAPMSLKGRPVDSLKSYSQLSVDLSVVSLWMRHLFWFYFKKKKTICCQIHHVLHKNPCFVKDQKFKNIRCLLEINKLKCVLRLNLFQHEVSLSFNQKHKKIHLWNFYDGRHSDALQNEA